MDSSDVWANPGLFQLDQDLQPIRVAGVPPDYFSPTGQRWGNPLYRWDVLAETGYAWWVQRIRRSCMQYDIVRLDHFRGFEAYWSIPGSEETAVNGEWIKAPVQSSSTASNIPLDHCPWSPKTSASSRPK